MLKRASRIAAADTNTKVAAQPAWSKPFRPHAKHRTAGAIPNDTTSAIESNSTPNALDVPVMRATRPSSMSRTMAKPMNIAACSKACRSAKITQA